MPPETEQASPLLLVVSGLPAAGKTTLASGLAQEFRLPLVTKDDYKQILIDHTPDEYRVSQNRRIGQASFGVMFHVAGVILRSGTSCIVETHFHRGLSDPKLLALAEQHTARLGQIFCTAELSELGRRHAARVASGARPFIDFPFQHTELSAHAGWEPLDLGAAPLLRVDTAQPELQAQARQWVRALLNGS